MRGLPKINGVYWLTLLVASVLGTNFGDLVSDAMQVGNVSGLPWYAAAFVLVFLAARITGWATPVLFWVAIVLLRAAATNVADSLYTLFGDFMPAYMIGMPICAALFVAAVFIYSKFNSRQPGEAPGVTVTPLWWVCMALAGVFATLLGDFVTYVVFAFGLGIEALLGLGTLLLFGVPAAVILYAGRRGQWFKPVYYWSSVVLIRSAGTGGGDFLGHGPLGIAWAPLASGAAFAAVVGWFYLRDETNNAPVVFGK